MEEMGITAYTVRFDREFLRWCNGEKEVYWNKSEAVMRARYTITELQINQKCTVHKEHKSTPLVTIKRKADGSIVEYGAEDSEEFNEYLASELVGCARGQADQYIPIGYVLSTYRNKILCAKGSWLSSSEESQEKIYATLPGALRRAKREVSIDETIDPVIINKRFLTPWGTETDRQIAEVRQFTEFIDVQWSINGAFERGRDACTKLQMREMCNSGFEDDWAEYIGKPRAFRNKQGDGIIF